VGTPEGQRHIPALASDSPVARHFGVPAGGGKITYVHRRMWPALVSFAGRFSKQRLAALNEVHTPAGKHRLLVTPFPDWVPTEVLQAAQKLTEKEAASQLAVVLSLSS
jgi:hypothetical protein